MTIIKKMEQCNKTNNNINNDNSNKHTTIRAREMQAVPPSIAAAPPVQTAPRTRREED